MSELVMPINNIGEENWIENLTKFLENFYWRFPSFIRKMVLKNELILYLSTIVDNINNLLI